MSRDMRAADGNHPFEGNRSGCSKTYAYAPCVSNSTLKIVLFIEKLLIFKCSAYKHMCYKIIAHNKTGYSPIAQYCTMVFKKCFIYKM